jgi:putative ATPase
LYRLLDATKLDAKLSERLAMAEEEIYANPVDPMVNWDVEDLRLALTAVGVNVKITVEHYPTQLYVSPDFLNRWFSASAADSKRPAYVEHLSRYLSAPEISLVRALFERSLSNRTVDWSTTVAFLKAIP